MNTVYISVVRTSGGHGTAVGVYSTAFEARLKAKQYAIDHEVEFTHENWELESFTIA